MTRSIGWGLAAVALLPAGVAAAAPATREGADALVAVFERYVGHPAAGEAGTVTVAPEGQSYRATFDVQRLMRGFEAFGMSVDPVSSAIVLTPHDDGTWAVTGDTFPPLVIHTAKQTTTMRSGSYAFEGVFDPKIPGFASATTRQTASTMVQDTPTLSQDRRSDTVLATQTSVAADGGTETLDIHYAVSGTVASMTVKPPPASGAGGTPPATPPVAFGYSMPESSIDLSVDRLHSRELLDAWAFFVAHPNVAAIKGAQEELRAILRAGAPFMAGFKEGASLDALEVTTPLGPFSVHKLASSIAIGNLPAIAEAAFALTYDGLKVPADALPPWSLGLVPTALDLKPSASGLHLAEAAREAIKDFDLNGDGFTPEQKAAISSLAIPPEGGKVTLAESRMTSDLLDLRMSGEASLTGQGSTGHLSVTGIGLDRAIATLQAAAGSDEMAAQVLSAFVAAKNLSKPNPDGSLTWDVEADATGAVTVNGAALK